MLPWFLAGSVQAAPGIYARLLAMDLGVGGWVTVVKLRTELTEINSCN